MNDDFWDTLLLAIEEGQVVPIVGRDLLAVDTPAGPALYHDLVARALAEALKVPADRLPPGRDVNDVICAHEGFDGDAMGLNPTVVRILRGLEVAPPRPLRQLAEIPAFRLFVSTTFDTLLDDAIRSVRGRAPAVVAFPPVSSHTDYDEALVERHGALVFQLLGRVSASASFALTEGQVLELMHDLMGGARRPDQLIAKLRASHLLLLGVSFPDWLTRFLLRMARAKPLWDSRPLMEVIAQAGAPEPELALFLRHFSPYQSRLYTGGSATAFVEELHRRWFERFPAGPAARADAADERPAEMAGGAVFISYASDDRAAAFRLADALDAAGLDVWVDRRLNPGADYRFIIEHYIRECSAFVPVLSASTQRDDERWFRKEWAQACDRAKSYFGTGRAFIFPVVIDDTPFGSLVEMRRDLFGRTAVHAAGGAPPGALVAELDTAQKAWRRQYARV